MLPSLFSPVDLIQGDEALGDIQHARSADEVTLERARQAWTSDLSYSACSSYRKCRWLIRDSG